MVKNPAASTEDRRHGFDPWVGKIPWRRKWQPTPVFLPEESHRQRSLAGLQSIGSKRVGYHWSDLACTHAQNLMSTCCVADFVLEPHIACKPLWEGHYISFNRWGNWGSERVLWTLWLLRSCQAPQEGFWLSVLPFKYGGGRWGKKHKLLLSLK